MMLNVGYATHHADWNWQKVSSPFIRIFYIMEGEAMLANVATVTKTYFIRLFKQEFAQTPVQYINRKKVERAQLMLFTSDCSVKEVAYKLGFSKGNMGIEPVTAKSRPLGDGATLEYDINFSQSGKQKLALGILPTNDVNPARGLRIGVRVDDGEMQTIDARQGYVDTFNEYTKENICEICVICGKYENDHRLNRFKGFSFDFSGQAAMLFG